VVAGSIGTIGFSLGEMSVNLVPCSNLINFCSLLYRTPSVSLSIAVTSLSVRHLVIILSDQQQNPYYYSFKF
jgi:hypothetical protein